jgi:acetolactate synthase-1/2/3 large subunit
MSDRPTVGEVIVAFLEECGCEATFGVISIHNMPFLDAIGRRGNIRYVPTRGEAGAVNMADACTRVSGKLSAAFTSTGTAAGNASGAMVEAQTAGTPILHITGQIDSPHVDKDHGFIHEARDQLGMLKSVSKSAWRVTSPETALETFKKAVQDAFTPPMGPVSVETPIDIQKAQIDWPAYLSPLPIDVPEPDEAALMALADELAAAKRPMLWLGGGARHAGEAVRRLVEMGFGVVTSVQGRGILPDTHPANLGAYNLYKNVEAFYQTCDAMVVVGSRLRSNETLSYKLQLPKRLSMIDADPNAEKGRPYVADRFVLGDAKMALEKLADLLEGRMETDPAFKDDLANAKAEAVQFMRDGFKPYERLVDAIGGNGGDDFIWVRDVTISNSTWGNRTVPVMGPRDGVHALGGGIGQGIQMAIGAAVGAPGRRVICLVGDGGLQVNIGEMATAAQEEVDITVVLMNSQDYEVIKNIQNAQYGGRQYYADIYTPDFAQIATAMGWSYQKLNDLSCAQTTLSTAIGNKGAQLIEVEMATIGDYARAFGGPPVSHDQDKKKD